MDFIDPEKKRRTKIKLLTGYVLIAVAILMTTLVLLYQANGYTFDKNGQLIQKGLVFVNSTPNPANIYLNGILNKATTNVRLNLAAGEYTIKLTRTGYRPWQRAVGVVGGSVQRFAYPFLIPEKLVSTPIATYAGATLTLQSPSRQYLLVQHADSDTTFDDYDLTNPKQLKPTTITIPTTVAAPETTGSWSVVGWSTDNQHVILDRVTNGINDYILFDRQVPAQSVDLTKTLGLTNTTVPSFDNNHYDQYFLFDTAAQTVSTASLTSPQPIVVLQHVLSYKSYSSNIFLYVTNYQAPTGEVAVRLLQGSTTYTLRDLVSGAATYILNLTQYNGSWYVVAGDSSEDKTYVYMNPQNTLGSQPEQPLVPVAILKVEDPNYADFSANAQFIMAENGDSFSVYDAQNDKSYSYQLTVPLAAGQHAVWMDGDRLQLVAGGNLMIFDYDDANQQTMQSAIGSQSFFDQAYQWDYVIAPSTAPATAPYALTQTSMLTPADQ